MAFVVHATAAVRISAACLFLAAVALTAPVAAQEASGVQPVMVALATATPSDPLPVQGQTLLTDRVKTGDRSFARLLLGGRVVLLARENSWLRITEVPGAVTIEVQSGRIAVTVDRENLHPEDLVAVRTPHAVATVPDDTLVVEVRSAASTFTVSGARVDVFPVDPVTREAVEPPTSATAEHVVTVYPSTTPPDVVATR
jgi:hypothetical protein